MTDQDQDNNNYELPPGIVLPQDNSPDYPNWKKGIIVGFIAGICGAFILWLIPLGGIPGCTIPILAFVVFFLMAGSIAAFRPPRDNNRPEG